jgi:hypothetical protein
MTLVVGGLESDLANLATNFGATIADCAALWADAIGSYFASVTPPSTSVVAAQATLQGQLAAAFAQPSAAEAMDAACQTFAVTVAVGMAPTFVAIAPVDPVNWAALFAEPYPSTAEEAAQRIAARLDVWARTGTATPSIGGSPVPWV